MCLFTGRFIEPTPCEYTTDLMNTNIPDIYKMYQISENIEPMSLDTKTESKFIIWAEDLVLTSKCWNLFVFSVIVPFHQIHSIINVLFVMSKWILSWFQKRSFFKKCNLNKLTIETYADFLYNMLFLLNG